MGYLSGLRHIKDLSAICQLASAGQPPQFRVSSVFYHCSDNSVDGSFPQRMAFYTAGYKNFALLGAERTGSFIVPQFLR